MGSLKGRRTRVACRFFPLPFLGGIIAFPSFRTLQTRKRKEKFLFSLKPGARARCSSEIEFTLTIQKRDATLDICNGMFLVPT